MNQVKQIKGHFVSRMIDQTDDDLSRITVLLMKRYSWRIKKVRARRKLMQKILIQMYHQYQQAYQELFELLSIKLMKLLLSESELFSDKISQDWWENTYSNLSDNEFYEIFHVYREFLNNLSLTLGPQLQPMENVSSVSVEKQIAISIYKLAKGYSYQDTSKLFGVHKSTVRELFLKFLQVIIEVFQIKINSLTSEDCQRLNEKLMKQANVPRAIGALLHIMFGFQDGNTPFELYGIVDITGKCNLIHISKLTEQDNYYKKLNDLCKELYANNESTSNEGYLVVTDQKVPDFECFLKQEIKDENEDLNSDMSIVLKVEDITVRKLAERWNIISRCVKFSPITVSVIKSCIILHNLYEEFIEIKGVSHEPVTSLPVETVESNTNLNINDYNNTESSQESSIDEMEEEGSNNIANDNGDIVYEEIEYIDVDNNYEFDDHENSEDYLIDS